MKRVGEELRQHWPKGDDKNDKEIEEEYFLSLRNCPLSVFPLITGYLNRH
jgi:hypothetical protein